MRKFKVGDVVKNIKIKDDNYSCLNKVGKIIHISSTFGVDLYSIEFSEPVLYGHSGDGYGTDSGKGKKGYCWNFKEDELKLHISILKIFLKEKQNEI